MPIEGRGSLPFSLIHGESLVAAASFGLEAAGIELLDASIGYDEVRASGRGLVLHDPACPLTPPEFLAAAVARSRESGAIVVGVREVTDTIKVIDADGTLGATVDRSALVSVASPVVLPQAVVAELKGFPEESFLSVVEGFSTRWPVEYLHAPALARRIVHSDDVLLLEALSRA